MLDSTKLRLTTLSENTAGSPRVGAEWGWSILIEAAERRILLDTGEGGIVLQNACALGVNVRAVDTIVLSHGHTDHTGGLGAILPMLDGPVPVLAHPDVWNSKYSRSKERNSYRFAGIPYRREYLESLGARFELSIEPQPITGDIVTSGEEPLTTEFEHIPDSMWKRVDGKYVADPLADDLSLFIRTDLGLVVVLGCAHRGVINVIRHAQRLMETDDVYMVVGGTHLMAASEERLDRTIEALRDIDVTWLGVSHCTGAVASAKLATAFPGRVFTNSAGNVITFPYE
jgi:7,8-dihydropterin-6-yl-methyl-4-(beta-D-ribofuranosyl)aminobenzene 5'-phosphate synthase